MNFQYLLPLNKVYIQHACHAIVQDRSGNLGNVTFLGCIAGIAPTHQDFLGIGAPHFGCGGFSERFCFRSHPLREFRIGFPVTEILFDNGNGFFRIEITGHADGHIIRDIIRFLLQLDGPDGRILQMLLRTNHRLCTIRMPLKKKRIQRFHGQLASGCQRRILLFIYRLQLRVETAEHAVHEAVSLNTRPVLNLIGRNILYIACCVIHCKGIGAVGANNGHQFVIFIGDGPLRGNITYGVYLTIEFLAFLRVGKCPIHLIKGICRFQERFFRLIILCAKLLCPLEHHVLQVVGQTGVVCRIVFPTGTYHDKSLNTRSIFIHRQIHLESVVKSINPGLHGIPLHALIAGAPVESRQSH